MSVYSASEILGQSRDSSPGAASSQRTGARARYRPEKSGEFQDECSRVHKNGHRFWTSIIIEPVRDANGQLMGFAEISHDITKIRNAQESIRESEHFLRPLIGSVVDYAIFTVDTEGYVTCWNPGAERTKGYTNCWPELFLFFHA